MAGPLHSFGTELVTRKTNHMIKGLELWVSPASGRRRGEPEFSAVACDFLHHAHIMKPYREALGIEAQ